MRQHTMCYHLFCFKQHPKFVGTFRCTLFHFSFNSFYQNPRLMEQLNQKKFPLVFNPFCCDCAFQLNFKSLKDLGNSFSCYLFHIFCRGYDFWLSMAWWFVGVMMFLQVMVVCTQLLLCFHWHLFIIFLLLSLLTHTQGQRITREARKNKKWQMKREK